MKMWLKIFSVIIVIFIVLSMFLLMNQEQKACCLCNSFRYHAPCLIDLETGKLLELDIYDPHHTKVAELAEEQTTMGAFSLLSWGEVSGYRDTSQRIYHLTVPSSVKTYNPALCSKCRKLLKSTDRYVLADLYNRETPQLIPIADGNVVDLRCYEITMTQDEENDGIIVIIQGILTS